MATNRAIVPPAYNQSGAHNRRRAATYCILAILGALPVVGGLWYVTIFAIFVATGGQIGLFGEAPRSGNTTAETVLSAIASIVALLILAVIGRLVFVRTLRGRRSSRD